MNNHLVKQEEKEKRRVEVQRVTGVRVKVEEGEDDYRSHEPKRTKRVKKQEGAQVEPQIMRVKQENIEPKLEEDLNPQWDYWHYTDEYTKEGNTFIKEDYDFLKKVRAKKPLPNHGIHSFQFKPCSLTTFSFGIITEGLKDQPHIKQTSEQSLFLTSFSKGTAVLNANGASKHWNIRNRLQVGSGEKMKVEIDMDRRELKFIKQRHQYKHSICPNFLGHQIYPFFQVKKGLTRFQILKTQ